MKNRPHVTIITPTYNRLKSLKEAVDCVQKQTYPYWEHIIVADGPDPRVERLVRNLNDKRVRYFYTPRSKNWGSSQRNLGLKKARGKFVACLDDDNTIRKDYVKEMVKRFTSKKIGYVICYVRYHTSYVLKPKLPFEIGGIDMLNFMVRKELAKGMGGWTSEYIQDFILIDKVSKISKGRFVKKILGKHGRLKQAKLERIVSYISLYAAKLANKIGIYK